MAADFVGAIHDFPLLNFDTAEENRDEDVLSEPGKEDAAAVPGPVVPTAALPVVSSFDVNAHDGAARAPCGFPSFSKKFGATVAGAAPLL